MQKDNISAGDEQVYKKDLDDLIDYIMQPNGAQQDVKKSKKKKPKKNKDGTSGEREASGEVGGTGNIANSTVQKIGNLRSQSPP